MNVITKEEYKELFNDLIYQNGYNISFIDPNVLTEQEYKSLCLEAISQDCYIITYIKSNSLSIESYKEICLTFIKGINEYVEDDILDCIDFSLINYNEFCLELIKHDKTNLTKQEYKKLYKMK